MMIRRRGILFFLVLSFPGLTAQGESIQQIETEKTVKIIGIKKGEGQLSYCEAKYLIGPADLYSKNSGINFINIETGLVSKKIIKDIVYMPSGIARCLSDGAYIYTIKRKSRYLNYLYIKKNNKNYYIGEGQFGSIYRNNRIYLYKDEFDDHRFPREVRHTNFKPEFMIAGYKFIYLSDVGLANASSTGATAFYANGKCLLLEDFPEDREKINFKEVDFRSDKNYECFSITGMDGKNLLLYYNNEKFIYKIYSREKSCEKIREESKELTIFGSSDMSYGQEVLVKEKEGGGDCFLIFNKDKFEENCISNESSSIILIFGLFKKFLIEEGGQLFLIQSKKRI